MAANILLLLPIMEAELDSSSRYTRNCSWQSRAGEAGGTGRDLGWETWGKVGEKSLRQRGGEKKMREQEQKMTILETEGGSVRVVGGKKK